MRVIVAWVVMGWWVVGGLCEWCMVRGGCSAVRVGLWVVCGYVGYRSRVVHCGWWVVDGWWVVGGV